MNNKLEQLAKNLVETVETCDDGLGFVGIVGDAKTGEILVGELGTAWQIGFMLAVAQKRFATVFKSRSLEGRDAFVDGLFAGKNSFLQSTEEFDI